MPYRTETRYHYTKKIVPVTKYRTEQYWDWGSWSFKTKQVSYIVYEEQVIKEPYTVQVWYDEPTTSTSTETSTTPSSDKSSTGTSSSGSKSSSGGTTPSDGKKTTTEPTVQNLFYNPLEQLIAKTNPEMADRLYDARVSGTPPPSGGGGSGGGGETTPTITKPPETSTTPFYTPLEQTIAKTNPDMAKNLYEKRTGTTIATSGGIDLKSMLAQGPPQEGAHQHQPGGPIEIATTEENALINAQRSIKPTIAFEHGVTITDQDYGSEISRLSADILSGQETIQSERQWLQDYNTYEQGINKNIATIQSAPSDSQWEIDINQDKKIDSNEVFTSQQAVDYFKGELSKAQDIKQKVETNIPLLESDITSMRKSKVYLEEYQRKGYYFDIKNGEYIFSEPKASEVVEKLYGDRPDLYIASELRTLWFGVLFAGGQDLLSGGGTRSLEANKEATAESILGSTRKQGESELEFTGRFWTSPEAIMDVWVPVATLGIAKGLTMAGRVIAPRAIGIGSKIASKVGPTGSKILSGTSKVLSTGSKILSEPVAQYGMKYGMYGALEAPTLIDIAQNQPEMLGSTIGKSLFRWETAWGAMDVGFSGKPSIKSIKNEEPFFAGQPVTEEVFMRDVQQQVTSSSPEIFITGERQLSEFNIKPKYTPGALEGEPQAQAKIYEFRGTSRDILGQPKTSYTGYILTSDKPLVAEVGRTTEYEFGSVTPRLHPSLTPGQEIMVSQDASYIFGTSTTEFSTKTGLLTKESKTIVSDFKGTTGRPSEVPYYFKTNELTEPGVKSEYYISDLTIAPRGREKLSVSGLGLSKEGYPGLYSEMSKNKLIVSPGSRAETEFVGEVTPRMGQDYNRVFVKEKGNIYSKTKLGEGGDIESGIGGSKVSVTKPTQVSLTEQVEGVEFKIQRGLSGGSGSLKLLAEKETQKVAENLGVKGTTSSGGTSGGMLLTKTAEDELETYVTPATGKTQGLSEETEYISKQWNETRPRQGTRNLSLIGMSLETMTGQGEVNIDERDQYTGELSGFDVKTDFGFKEDTTPDFGMRTVQDTRTDLIQSSRQEQQSLSRMDQTSDLISTEPVESPTPTDTPRALRPRPPWIPRRKKDEEEDTKLYKSIKRQRYLITKKTKRQSKGLSADLLSVTQSQARYGKSTQPKLTKKLWEEGEKTMFKRVPTEELLKGGKTKADNLIGEKNNKGGKKNVYY